MGELKGTLGGVSASRWLLAYILIDTNTPEPLHTETMQWSAGHSGSRLTTCGRVLCARVCSVVNKHPFQIFPRMFACGALRASGVLASRRARHGDGVSIHKEASVAPVCHDQATPMPPVHQTSVGIRFG